MATATSAAAVLPPADREPFLDAVARQLAGHEPGPGVEHRAVAATFSAFFKPPDAKTAGFDIAHDLERLRLSKAVNLPPIEYGGDLRHVRYRGQAR